MTSAQSLTRLPCGNRVLDLTHTQVMGILNVTPDSFSDGGRFAPADAALRHAEAMVLAGASLIDVGGESTRPGARVVLPQEELDRVAPVVERISRELDVIISVDTSAPMVITEVARLGAGLINDVRSLRREGAVQAAAATGLPICLMHMLGEPGDMQDNPHYADLVGEVSAFLVERMECCAAAGIAAERIVLDPGFGFAKNAKQNLKLLKEFHQLNQLGYPILSALSRKRFIGEALGGADAGQRAVGSVAGHLLSIQQGACMVRAHDVKAMSDAIKVWQAMNMA